jgi:hypothetical protein
MQHALRGLPVRYAQCLSRRTSLQPHGRALMRVLCVQPCERAALVPAPAATAPRLRARASDARASLRRRPSHARPRRRGEACTARVAGASRDEEAADVGPSPEADEGPGAAYIVGSLAAVMGLGIANRVLYKMALQPLGNYVFFLAQCAPRPPPPSPPRPAPPGPERPRRAPRRFQTFGYVLVYFGFLLFRYRCAGCGAGPPISCRLSTRQAARQTLQLALRPAFALCYCSVSTSGGCVGTQERRSDQGHAGRAGQAAVCAHRRSGGRVAAAGLCWRQQAARCGSQPCPSRRPVPGCVQPPAAGGACRKVLAALVTGTAEQAWCCRCCSRRSCCGRSRSATWSWARS